MQIRRFKNKLIRAIIFCFSSTLFFSFIIYSQNLMGITGVIFLTSSLFYIFQNEKMIDLANSKRYRFSLVRQIFNVEMFIHTLLSEKFKKFSTDISIFLIPCLFIIWSQDFWLFLLLILNLTVLKILFFYGK